MCRSSAQRAHPAPVPLAVLGMDPSSSSTRRLVITRTREDDRAGRNTLRDNLPRVCMLGGGNADSVNGSRGAHTALFVCATRSSGGQAVLLERARLAIIVQRDYSVYEESFGEKRLLWLRENDDIQSASSIYIAVCTRCAAVSFAIRIIAWQRRPIHHVENNGTTEPFLFDLTAVVPKTDGSTWIFASWASWLHHVALTLSGALTPFS